jgi:KDO2-lipid IV(A) lauroyltransferase
MLKLLLKVWFCIGRWPRPLYVRVSGILGLTLAALLWLFAKRRKHVMQTNLALCFPEKSAQERALLAKRHLRLYLQTFFDRAWLWQADEVFIRQQVQLEGLDILQQCQQQGPVILLAPHFLGLDAGWTRLSLETSMVTMYSNQKSQMLNDLIRTGRQRFGLQSLMSRQEGIKPVIRQLKAGKPLYYLPDMDFGAKDAVFVPFFGVLAATVTAVARIARLLGAQVLPCPTFVTSNGYRTVIMSPLANFPGDDDVLATTAINQMIESLVLDHPPEYLWLHKRFKTRPPGQSVMYD